LGVIGHTISAGGPDVQLATWGRYEAKDQK
jgi:hypothetical protein